MNSKSNTENKLRAQVAALEGDFKQGDYFRVVFLAPQLLVQIVNVLCSYTDEYFRRKGLLDESPDDSRVNSLIQRLHRTESDRAQIAGALSDMYDANKERSPGACAAFERHFSMLETLVSMRNRLAHEYYATPSTIKSLKACAAGGIELLRIFNKELDDA